MLWLASLFGALTNVASNAFSVGNAAANTNTQYEVAKAQMDADRFTKDVEFQTAEVERGIQESAANSIRETTKDAADSEVALAKVNGQNEILEKRIEETKKLQVASKLNLEKLHEDLYDNRATPNYGRTVA